ncbi:TPA: alanine racemase, partial [Streptococcus pyogenes]
MISSFHRPTVARVNLQAIKENVASVQKHIPLGVKTYAVVKADAYGHGAVQVSKALLPQVDGYCVSNLDEALQLRQAGIDKEILILGVLLPNELELAVANAITVTIASLDWIALARLEKKECQGLKVHVKVDSGMGRIGLRSSKEVNLLIDSLKELGADVEGIFTHFATADEADDTKFNQQLQFFKKLIAGLEDKPRLVHASNSATSIWHSDTIFNAVRLGIVSYGLNPSG